MNDETFKSIISSQRLLNEIRICRQGQNVQVERFIVIVEKFKPSLRSLNVIIICSRENCFSLLLTSSEVKRLSLNLALDVESTKCRRVKLKQFRKLRQLEFSCCSEANRLWESSRATGPGWAQLEPDIPILCEAI